MIRSFVKVLGGFVCMALSLLSFPPKTGPLFWYRPESAGFAKTTSEQKARFAPVGFNAP